MNKKYGFFRCGMASVSMMWKSNRRDTLLYIGSNLAYAFAWMAQTLVLQHLFDAVEEVGAGTADAAKLAAALTVTGVVYLLYHLLDGFCNCYSEVLFLRVSASLNQCLFGRIGRMNAVEFEDPARLNVIEKAKLGVFSFPGFFFTVIDVISYYIPYFIFMGWYLFRLKPVLALSIGIVFLPTLLSKLAVSVSFRELEEKEAPLRREADYYEACLTDREYLRDTRFLGANKFFAEKLLDVLRQKNYWRMQVVVRQNLLQIVLKLTTACGYGVIIWMLFCAVMQGEIAVSAFAAIVATMSSLFRFMDKMVMERLSWAAQTQGAVANFLEFTGEEAAKGEPAKKGTAKEAAKREAAKRETARVKSGNEKMKNEESAKKGTLNAKPEMRGTAKSAPEEKEETLPPTGEELILEHVDFSYPQAANPALQDISLRIPRGQVIALVGENGSGKTTLARILTGLYEPSAGTARCGERSLKEGLRGETSGIFQKFCRYQMPLWQNLAIGSQLRRDDEKLREICGEIKILAERSPHAISTDAMTDGKQERLSLDTMLGREFDGLEVSGGQWQRIAIGRGIYRDHDLIILDEPTAAIDPLEETRLYEQFAEICRGKTAVLITHRIGAARLADRILVMRRGRIVQDGTWSGLLKEKGAFRTMYEAQKQWYE